MIRGLASRILSSLSSFETIGYCSHYYYKKQPKDCTPREEGVDRQWRSNVRRPKCPLVAPRRPLGKWKCVVVSTAFLGRRRRRFGNSIFHWSFIDFFIRVTRLVLHKGIRQRIIIHKLTHDKVRSYDNSFVALSQPSRSLASSRRNNGVCRHCCGLLISLISSFRK